ncbi:MAG: ATP-dependent helicase C-terminal domain-containing protein [Actinomycetaceae bacterium]|nr:ATP-dependent helicase C-terminal domain-containing protein [Actinomycetaceae bacterium]
MKTLAQVWAGATAPVKACEDALVTAIGARQPIILTAAPGSGKTTLVPLLVRHVLDRQNNAGNDSDTPPSGKVLVAQPRRVAAMAAAGYVATQLGEEVGQRIGLSMRGVRQVSARTRIEFTTTGSLLRRMLADPDLQGVDAVIVDEVHERHLDADLVLAFLHDLTQLREDLTAIAMSATADLAALRRVFPNATHLDVPAPTYPLEELWAPVNSPVLERHHMSLALASHLAAVAERAYRTHGPTLVFAPAIADVEALVADLQARDLPARPLHSAVNASQQRAALAGGDQIVVATDIAQTSLTIDAVRCVVDSGLSRQPQFDPSRDTPRLVTVRASRASMVQRAGRANRQGPGVVYRCLHQVDWARAPQFDPPEAENADLTAAVLAASAWSSVEELQLPSPWPQASLMRARQVGQEIGALQVSDGGGGAVPRISDSGKILALIPTDPRLAHALLRASELVPSHLREQVARTVALLTQEPRLRDPDLVKAVRGPAPAQWERFTTYAQRWAKDYAATLATTTGAGSAGQGSIREWVAPGRGQHARQDQIQREDVPGLVTALAFPRLVARRNENGTYQSVGAGALRVPEDSSLHLDEWVAAASIQRLGDNTWVRAAAPIPSRWVDAVCGHYRRSAVEVKVKGGKLVALQTTGWGAIVGSPHPVAVKDHPLAARRALEEAARSRGLDLFSPAGRTAQLIAQVRYLARGELLPPQLQLPVELLELAPPTVAQHLDTLLGTRASDVLAGGSLREVDLRAGLYALWGWELVNWVETNWPREVELPSGRMVRVELDPERGPTVRAKLQECFGWRQVQTVCGQALTVELLSPAGRPLAITSDLESFFNQAYPQVRADMRGRYPKHPWPEDPWDATATGLTKAAQARRERR